MPVRLAGAMVFLIGFGLAAFARFNARHNMAVQDAVLGRD